MTLKEIKKDLRRIQHFERVLKSKRIIENQCRERIEYLKTLGGDSDTGERDRIVYELEATIKQLNIPDFIRRGTVLKNRYIQYINMLEEQDQALINLYYINCFGTQGKIARMFNYSEEWVKKRLHSACENLLNIINKANGIEGA